MFVSPLVNPCARQMWYSLQRHRLAVVCSVCLSILQAIHQTPAGLWFRFSKSPAGCLLRSSVRLRPEDDLAAVLFTSSARLGLEVEWLEEEEHHWQETLPDQAILKL